MTSWHPGLGAQALLFGIVFISKSRMSHGNVHASVTSGRVEDGEVQGKFPPIKSATWKVHASLLLTAHPELSLHGQKVLP